MKQLPILLVLLWPCCVAAQQAVEPPPIEAPGEARIAPDVAADANLFKEQVAPVLQKYCVRCHNADDRQSGVRVDHLTGIPEDSHFSTLSGVRSQLSDGVMPPEDEAQPSDAERRAVVEWIDRVTIAAKSRKRDKNGSVRRLTVTQYRHTLRDLLGLREDLTDTLPPDALSKDGFANHERTLALSPLLVETYFDIATQALDRCIVDEKSKPVIQSFRVELGSGINSEPCPDKLILGANSELLGNGDFVVTELAPAKSFPYQPFAMQRKFDFIEGYQGNDTVRGWRHFDSIYHAVFACVRGTPGYPKGEPNEVLPVGLALRPAIPSPEIFGRSNTYGPMANFKISLRELPSGGDFRVKVKAARYDDGLLLDPGTPPASEEATIVVSLPSASMVNGRLKSMLTISEPGIYQVDVGLKPGPHAGQFSLDVGTRSFSGRLFERETRRSGEPGTPDKSGKPKVNEEYEAPAASKSAENTEKAERASPRASQPADQPIADDGETTSAVIVLRMEAGDYPIQFRYGNNARLGRLRWTRLATDHPHARRFAAFEGRRPTLGVHLGLRRDCGSTLTRVGAPLVVESTEARDYVFTGAINDFPSPDVEPNNVNYLAGIREIGIRSEYTDGRDMPRLIVRSVEFEGPLYDQWPPATHRNIFIESQHRDAPPRYAREVLEEFASRAFRRPVTPEELSKFVGIWEESYEESRDFVASVKDALVVVLTSPQFLFLVEASAGPQAEDLDDYELASKLSYFLWNAPPDERLLGLAARRELHGAIDEEIDRLVSDPRFEQFVDEFATQWLSLDKLDVLAVDADRFPRLTRDVKAELRREPVEFLRHLIRENLSVRNLIHSDFILANELVASYYGLGERVESGFRFQPVRHENEHLGGILAQAGILAGLSDGREANPVKRGAWLARKIIARPPDDPPPNVPQLKEEDGLQLSLREKLERHRNQPGCAKCHAGIDPWGLPFEQFDAGGLFRSATAGQASSRLPDGTEVDGLHGANGLKTYLADRQVDQVAYSFLRHVACYATGRSLTYNEEQYLREEATRFQSREYRLLDMIRFVVKSDIFLKK